MTTECRGRENKRKARRAGFCFNARPMRRSSIIIATIIKSSHITRDLLIKEYIILAQANARYRESAREYRVCISLSLSFSFVHSILPFTSPSSVPTPCTDVEKRTNLRASQRFAYDRISQKSIVGSEFSSSPTTRAAKKEGDEEDLIVTRPTLISFFEVVPDFL